MSETVKKCANDAWQKQFPVFGVQFYGECWSGPSGYVTYDKDGFNLQGCWEGVGRTRNNYVYAFTSNCCIVDLKSFLYLIRTYQSSDRQLPSLNLALSQLSYYECKPRCRCCYRWIAK